MNWARSGCHWIARRVKTGIALKFGLSALNRSPRPEHYSEKFYVQQTEPAIVGLYPAQIQADRRKQFFARQN